MVKPKVSIIIYTYNRADGLSAAVNSILNQNYENYEIIVLDAGTGTLSYDLFEKLLFHNKNICYLKVSDPTVPVGRRLNQGLEVATGDYISFLTDTSTYTPNSLTNLISEIGGFDFVYGKIYTLDYETKKPTFNNFSFLATITNILRRDDIHISSVLIKKDFLDKIGGFSNSLKKSYTLDLWNRAVNKGLVRKSSEIISGVFVNVPEITPPFELLDFNDIFVKDYPLKKYWSTRKSISFNLWNVDNAALMKVINDLGGCWSVTTNKFDSDVLLTNVYSTAVLNYEGTLLYYLDPTIPITQPLYDLCDGIVSPIAYEDPNKPVYVLRPLILKSEIEDLDNFFVPYPIDLNIFCPDLHKSQDNVDFLKEMIPLFYSNFKNVYIFHSNKINVFYQIEGYENLHFIRFDMDNSDIFELKKRGFSCILSLNRNTVDYKNNYDLFLLSTKLRIPFISYENLALDLLEHTKDIYVYANGTALSEALKNIKELSYRTNLVSNSRIKAYLNFFNFSISSSFLHFINTVFVPQSVAPIPYFLDISQDQENNSFLIQELKQGFKCNKANLCAIEVFLNVKNIYGKLEFKLLDEFGQTQRELTRDNYKLINGSNVFVFDVDANFLNKQMFFSLEAIEGLSCEISCINFVKDVGNLWTNGNIKKATLRFKTYSLT